MEEEEMEEEELGGDGDNGFSKRSNGDNGGNGEELVVAGRGVSSRPVTVGTLPLGCLHSVYSRNCLDRVELDGRSRVFGARRRQCSDSSVRALRFAARGRPES
jgi:hypothetical protein